MLKDVQPLLEQYWMWLRDQTSLRQINGWVEITTPYLDRHNDCLQIYAKREGASIVLTDNGYILEDLEQSGCKIDSAKRRALFKTTINGFGIECRGMALEVRASENDFALKKHSLVQAMLAINDLFYLALPKHAKLFYENVAAWLDDSNIKYMSNERFVGTSGYSHRFDFLIPKSDLQPERMLHTINRPNRNAAEGMAFSWLDIEKVRHPDSRAFAILNDSRPVSSGIMSGTEEQVYDSLSSKTQMVPRDVMDAFQRYQIHPVLWSRREEVREVFTA